MAKVNDTTTFPITTPAAADLLFGTDVSNTSSSADGETVNFEIYDVLNFLASGATGAPKVQTAGIQDDAVTPAKLNVVTGSYSGSLGDSSSTILSRPNATSFIPSVTGTDIEAYLAGGGLKIRNTNSSSTRTWAVSWSYVA